MGTDEITTVLAVAGWLRDSLTSGLMPRQLPVEGIDTKWITGRGAVLTALLQGPPPDDRDAAHAADAPGPDVVGGHDDRRLSAIGLRPRPRCVRVAVLDQVLRRSLGGLRDVAVTTDQLRGILWSPEHVVIIENLETALTLPDLPGTVVIHSLGHDVDALRDLDWARTAPRVTYWGDLDAQGFAILSRVPGLGYPALTRSA